MHHVFKLKINRLNNRDFNIDQNNPDYDFFHNRAALVGHTNTTAATAAASVGHDTLHTHTAHYTLHTVHYTHTHTHAHTHTHTHTHTCTCTHTYHTHTYHTHTRIPHNTHTLTHTFTPLSVCLSVLSQ